MMMWKSNRPQYICARFRRKVSSLKSDSQRREAAKKASVKFLKKKFTSPCRLKKATYLCAPFRG